MSSNLIILTAESKNFVPVEIQKAAEALGMDAKIVDVTKCVLLEGLSGNSPESHECMSCLYLIEPGEKVPNPEGGDDIAGPSKMTKLSVGPDTFVIPRLNEHHLEIKLGMLKRLEKLGCTLINTPESMELCNDKLMSQVILNSAGIKTPMSFTVQSIDDIEVVVTQFEKDGLLKYPVILKTLRGTHGIGVMKLDSRSSLVSVAQTLSKEGMDFLIQEFCKHDQSCRVIMIGDEVLAANLRGQPKEKDEFRTNSHLGSETQPYEPGEEEIATSRRIVELFGSKFCAIDYIMLDSDGGKEMMVLEVNGSPGLEAIQKNWPDKNLAEIVAKFAMGDKDKTVTPGDPGADAEVVPSTDMPEEFISEVEPVMVHRIMDMPVEARIDTGAKSSSIHCDSVEFQKDGEWVRFKRGDITFKVPLARTVLIKNLHGGEATRRPVVKLDLTIHGKRINGVEFTLTNRTHMKYEVLIGRNVIERLGLPVAVAQADADGEVPESEVYGEEE